MKINFMYFKYILTENRDSSLYLPDQKYLFVLVAIGLEGLVHGIESLTNGHWTTIQGSNNIQSQI